MKNICSISGLLGTKGDRGVEGNQGTTGVDGPDGPDGIFIPFNLIRLSTLSPNVTVPKGSAIPFGSTGTAVLESDYNINLAGVGLSQVVFTQDGVYNISIQIPIIPSSSPTGQAVEMRVNGISIPYTSYAPGNDPDMSYIINEQTLKLKTGDVVTFVPTSASLIIVPFVNSEVSFMVLDVHQVA